MAATGTSFVCAKCQHTSFSTDEIRATGKYSRFFDMQNKKFMAVSCDECGFTEIYKGNSSTLGNIFDLFTSG
jgi:predicted nucleic-acid-binding Zn-ribbon protein